MATLTQRFRFVPAKNSSETFLLGKLVEHRESGGRGILMRYNLKARLLSSFC